MAKPQQSGLTQAQLELRRKLQDERRRVLSVVQQPLSSEPDEPAELEETAQRANELAGELAVRLRRPRASLLERHRQHLRVDAPWLHRRPPRRVACRSGRRSFVA